MRTLPPFFAAFLLLWGCLAHAQDFTQAEQNPTCNRSFTSDRCSYRTGEAGGFTRQGIVCLPADPRNAPVVLVFHGHGGCALQAAVSTGFHSAWPQAIVVYPDGLTGTRTPNDPDGSGTGWQLYPGDMQDRDVALVDLVLGYLGAVYGADLSRAYATGHSNGSRFTGVLWASRAASFRAFVFNSAQPGDLFTRYPATPPRPMALTMGRTDCIVPFNAAQGCPTLVVHPENYQEASINLARRLLGLPEGATPTGLLSQTGGAGKELGLYVHEGGHVWPEDETSLAVQFMQRN
jgi:polyhydroxybutyrate depolymerase